MTALASPFPSSSHADAEHMRRLRSLYELSMTLSGNPADVFRRITRMIGELLDVPVVYLSQIDGGELRFLSVYSNGNVIANAGHCPLANSPCDTVARAKDIRIYQDVAAQFPEATFLKQHNASAYCGFPSLDSNGNVVAVTCLLDESPRLFSEEDQYLLAIFGQRIAMEIERQRKLDERARAKEALRHSENMLRAFIDHSPAMITLTDLEGRYLMVNKMFSETYNISPEDAVGESIGDMVSPEHFKGFFEHLRHVQETGEATTRERTEILSSGATFRGLFTKFPVRNADGEIIGIGNISTDISQLKRTEEKLHSVEARFSDFLKIAPEAIVSTDADGIILLFNNGAERTFGRKAEDVIGQPLEILLPASVRAKHKGYFQKFIDSPGASRLMSQRGEITGLRADGSEFPAEASISKLQSGDETILTVTLHDIVDRKTSESVLRTALYEAQEANKAKQLFLANMSHELRTPLNAILGFSEILEQEMFGPIGNKRYHEYAHDIATSAKCLLELVNEVLDISKIEAGKQELNLIEVDIEAAANEAIHAMRVQIEDRNLHITATFVNDLSAIRADKLALRQIFLNLLSNAIKFTPEGGQINVSVSQDQRGFTNIRISDTGVGIPAEDIPNILTPFAQSENLDIDNSDGIGLGLSIVNALVHLHGGMLKIESEVGVGTNVLITLPSDPKVE